MKLFLISFIVQLNNVRDFKYKIRLHDVFSWKPIIFSRKMVALSIAIPTKYSPAIKGARHFFSEIKVIF